MSKEYDDEMVVEIRSKILTIAHLKSWLRSVATEQGDSRKQPLHMLDFRVDVTIPQLLSGERPDSAWMTLDFPHTISFDETALTSILGQCDSSMGTKRQYRHYKLKLDDWPMLLIECFALSLHVSKQTGYIDFRFGLMNRFRCMFPNANIDSLSLLFESDLLTDDPTRNDVPQLYEVLMNNVALPNTETQRLPENLGPTLS